MNLLQQALNQIRDLFLKLTPPQRLSIGILTAVILASMVALVLWASQTELEILYAAADLREADPEFLPKVEDRLVKSGIPYEVRGGAVYVERGRKHQAKAELAKDKLVLRAKDHLEWLGSSDLSETGPRFDARLQASLKRDLEQSIAGFPEVRRASVQFTKPKDKLVFQHEIDEGKASVYVQLKYGEGGLSAGTVEGIASLVEGAVPNLPGHRVRIVASNGQTYSIPDRNDPLRKAGEYQRVKTERERDAAAKVKALLHPYAPEAVVVVEETFEQDSKEVVDHKIDPDVFIKDHDWSRDEVAREDRVQGGPGVTPNVGATTYGGGGTFGTTIKEQENWKDYNKTDTKTVSPAGKRLDLTCAVVVPLHQFPNVPRDEKGRLQQDDPMVAALYDGTAKELEPIRRIVMNALTITDAAKVSIAAVPYLEEVEPERPSAVQDAWAWLDAHGGQIFLGLVTLVTLFMIYSAISRAIPKPEPVLIEEEDVPEEMIEQEEAEEQILIEERTLSLEERKALFIQNKVSEIVRENPRMAARLIKGWLWEGR